MADKAIHEMIAAFAVGCMDKDNFIQFKDYIIGGGDLPKRELGELQNIISMIPVILELENPDPSIKDMVAKKLIGMKEEIKTKILEDKKKTAATTKAKTSWITPSSTKISKPTEIPPVQNTLTFGEKKPSTSTSAFQFADEEPAGKPTPRMTIANTEKEKMKESKKIERLTPPEPPRSVLSSKQSDEDKKPQQEKISSGIAGWIAILLVIVLFTLLGYYIYSSVDSLRKQVDDLKSEVTSVRSQLSTVNNFITNYTSLIEFFNYKDIIIYNLTGTDANEKASAHLLLSFGQKEGLIQFKSAKPLQQNQVYQVWMINRKQSYSLGIYQPKGSEYIKITTFPFLPKETIESFRITIEENGGATSPSSSVYLVSPPTGVRGK